MLAGNGFVSAKAIISVAVLFLGFGISEAAAQRSVRLTRGCIANPTRACLIENAVAAVQSRRSSTDPGRLVQLAVVLAHLDELESAGILISSALDQMAQAGRPEVRGSSFKWATEVITNDLPIAVARELLNSVAERTNRDRPDILAYTLEAVAKLEVADGQLELAQQTYVQAFEAAMQIPWEELRTQQLIATLELIVDGFDAEFARKPLTQVLRMSESAINESMIESIGLLSSMAAAHAKVGNVGRALEIARTIGSRDTLVRIAATLAEGGHLEQALAVVDDPSLGVFDWRAIALAGIATAQVKAGNRQAAVATLELLGEINMPNAVVSVATAQASAGEISKALVRSLAIDDREWRATALSSVADTIAKAGVINEPQRLLDQFIEALQGMSGLDSILYTSLVNSMAMAFTESENFDQARDLIIHSLQQAEQIEDPYSRADTLIALAIYLSSSDSLASTRNAMRQALTRAAGAIDAADDRSENLLPNIATALALLGETRLALEVVGNIKYRNWRDGPLALIARAQAEAGNVQQALSTVDEIGEGSQRALAWAEIAVVVPQ